MKDNSFYSEIGFKCGLEIHQRLSTDEKLFCSCSAKLMDGTPYSRIERKQRAVAGELGLVDVSTKFESGRERSFVYNIFRNSTCLVDIDEEPPHEANRSAVEIALKLAASLNCITPDEVEPMRKEVVDGSDPSAFQRSMMVGYNGYLEVDNRKVEITSVFLEEESSGIDETREDLTVYNVDRLGVPLIEIDTAPVIKNPVEAKEVAKRIGLLLRLTGHAQRGIGSIRQDVNVSISGGTRVEIKGLQQLDMMDLVIENEIERQTKLIEIKKELLKRKASVGEIQDLTKFFKDNGSNAKIIKEALLSKGVILGFILKKFRGMLGCEINPNKRLGTEISDYAKRGGVKGLIHSDEKLELYGFAKDEIEKLSKDLKLGQDDSFIIIAGREDVCKKAIELARKRAKMAMEGVPPETRGANSNDSTTRFMRPLPGGSRMYPETDSKPILIDKKRYEELKKEKLDVNKIRNKLEAEIKNKQISDQLLWSPELQLYERIVKTVKVPNYLVAVVLIEKFRGMKRNGIRVDEIDDDVIVEIFKAYESGKITKLGIEELIKSTPKSKADLDKIIKQKNLGKFGADKIKKLVKESKGKDKGEIIREIMSKYRLKVDGEELNKILK